MLKQLEGARLGIFIFFGTILLIISIFLLGNKEKLFTRTIEIKAYFNQIEGLKSGAPVRLSGYDVGSVSSISLASDTSAKVEVTMRIDSELKHFIRLDSFASVETEGLVGKKIVSITPGSQGSAEITDGGIIPSKSPVNIAKIIEETENVMGYMKDLTKDFSEIFAKVNKGEGSLGKLVNDDKLYNSAVNITQSADKSLKTITARLDEISNIIISTSGTVKSILTDVDKTVIDVRGIINKIDNGEGALGKLIGDKNMGDSIKTIITNLTRTSDEAHIAVSRLAENMEALKHNWLFKGYFEQRGYWDTPVYEQNIDTKLNELKKQNELLDAKMKELKALGTKLEKNK
ncbi:MAG: MlaD family protein [Bacteroidetes bacterium]|nr:MlaD family protein [Bacteroidota bacterium]